MTQDEWLKLGIEQGWCSETYCSTHGLMPQTEEEELAWDDEEDPCEHSVRVWSEEQQESLRRH